MDNQDESTELLMRSMSFRTFDLFKSFRRHDRYSHRSEIFIRKVSPDPLLARNSAFPGQQVPHKRLM
jgi:hypothetical protein